MHSRTKERNPKRRQERFYLVQSIVREKQENTGGKKGGKGIIYTSFLI